MQPNIIVIIFTEPVNTTLDIINLTSVRLCWSKPRYGRVKRYELTYFTLTKPSIRHRVMLKKMQERTQCHALGGLEAFEDYVIELRAWGGSLPGTTTRITFLLDINSKPYCNFSNCKQYL
jgi:hypothetical protein